MDKLKIRAHGILRWSEKYLKTDMLYLARGGFWLTFGQIVSSVSIFILAVAFAHFISKEIYGTYKYILSITGILTILTLRGMDSAVLYSVARNFENVLFRALKIKIKWGLLSAVGSILLAIYYYLNGNAVLAISFLIAAGFLPIMDPLGLYMSFLQGKKLFRISATYNALSQVGSAVVMITTLFFTKNLFVIILAYFASWTILRLIFFIITIKTVPPNKKDDPKALTYGKHSSFVNMLDSLIGSIDGLLIFHYLGPVNLAIYSFALAPVSQIRGVFGNIPTLAIPKLSVRPAREMESVLKKRIIMMATWGLIVSVAYIIAAPYIYKIFFPKYIGSVFFSQIFSVSIMLSFPQIIFGAATASKLTLIPKKMLYLWNIPGIIFITSVILLINPFGVVGVIYSRLISLASGFAINYIIWKKVKEVESLEQSSVELPL